MAVVPDFLLNTATSPAGTGRAAAKTPSQDRPAAQERFADVFAQEQPREPVRSEKPRDTSDSKAPTQARKNEPGRARDGDDRVKRSGDDDRTADAKSQADSAAKSGEQSAAATDDSGKTLPVAQGEDAKAPVDALLDPLFMFGMTGQFPQPVATPAPTPQLPTGTAAEAAATATTQALDPAALLGAAVATAAQATATGAGTGATATPAKAGEQQAADDGLAQLLGQAPQAQGDAAKAATNANNLAATQLQGLLPADGAPAPAADQAASAALAATLDKGDGQDAAVPSKADAFADKLTALSQALSTPAATARPVTATVPGQPLSPQAGNFSEAVVDKVMWMSSQNLKTADIQMEPAQLGKLEVRIDMTQDQTQVTFASPHADVREALDNGSQRLRELFAQQGMNLANVNVSDQSSGQAWQQSQQGGQSDNSRRGSRGAGGSEDEAVANVAETRGSATLAARSLVDYYA
ncbi:flagellar hook-length control protein FliK [Pseudomonas sp. AS2.8]|uniref:flagellar hook-length control protein FliK n=1 Tax=Pseudomonas sp. AS2.8 TaxID=2587128 RepID=UPI0017BF56C8|nr:flagellar hook-length control protein FliK [Pseudomonas sp. AS2.8]MBB2895215.1 flagellar hook-length control protein FliK [Pseudomonas sp. AS2.8]